MQQRELLDLLSMRREECHRSNAPLARKNALHKTHLNEEAIHIVSEQFSHDAKVTHLPGILIIQPWVRSLKGCYSKANEIRTSNGPPTGSPPER